MIRYVRMPVVLIVDVRVGMFEQLVLVPMLVPLAQMEPEAKRHECCRSQEQWTHRLAIKKETERGSDERCE